MSNLRLTEIVLRHDRVVMAIALGLVVVVAATYILAGGGTGMSVFGMLSRTGPMGALISGTPSMAAATHWSVGYALVILVMWWLMMIAMMVPTAAPVILLFGALHSDKSRWSSVLFAAGYVVIWGAFSGIATALQGALVALGLMSSMYMTVVTPWLGAALLIGSGLYQFTPLKAACLSHCRGPVEALTRHRRTGPAAAFRMGMRHGAFCLGCCWALMALLFVGGIMNIWWILGITLYVGFEKLAPGGEHLARPMGLALILGGFALLQSSLALI
jgi:predicted metal-binding membrane protein